MGIILEKLKMTIFLKTFSLNFYACLHHLKEILSFISTFSIPDNVY